MPDNKDRKNHNHKDHPDPDGPQNPNQDLRGTLRFENCRLINRSPPQLAIDVVINDGQGFTIQEKTIEFTDLTQSALNAGIRTSGGVFLLTLKVVIRLTKKYSHIPTIVLTHQNELIPYSVNTLMMSMINNVSQVNNDQFTLQTAMQVASATPIDALNFFVNTFFKSHSCLNFVLQC